MNESNHSDDALAELLTLVVKKDKWGNTVYFNQHGRIHRVHGPAVIHRDGSQWCANGVRHRTDGPAVVMADGRHIEWWLNGKMLTEQEYNERIKSI